MRYPSGRLRVAAERPTAPDPGRLPTAIAGRDGPTVVRLEAMADAGGGRLLDSVGPGSPRLVRLALAGVAAALCVDIIALTLDLIRLRRLRNGATLENVGLDISSTLSQAANLLVPLSVLVAGVVFVRWFHGAYQRLAQVETTLYEPQWAAIGWVVPGLNLVRPPAIMRELVSKPGPRSADEPGPILALGWWILWLEGAVIQVVLRLISPVTNWGWTRWQSAALLSDLVLLAALACAVALVKVVGTRQQGLPELQPSPAMAAASPLS